MKLALTLLPLLLLPVLALSSPAEEDFGPMNLLRMETEKADRIQTRILDPILGGGRSSAFVKLAVSVKRSREESSHFGEGRSTKNHYRPVTLSTTTNREWRDISGEIQPSQTMHPIVFSTATLPTGSSATSMQEASQVRAAREDTLDLSIRYPVFRVVILHDAQVPRRKLDQIRAAVFAAYRQESPSVVFQAMDFYAAD